MQTTQLGPLSGASSSNTFDKSNSSVRDGNLGTAVARVEHCATITGELSGPPCLYTSNNRFSCSRPWMYTLHSAISRALGNHLIRYPVCAGAYPTLGNNCLNFSTAGSSTLVRISGGYQFHDRLAKSVRNLYATRLLNSTPYSLFSSTPPSIPPAEKRNRNTEPDTVDTSNPPPLSMNCNLGSVHVWFQSLT